MSPAVPAWVFEKMHGARNDFLFAPCPSLPPFETLDGLRSSARTWCDRTAGLGADGFVFWRSAPASAAGTEALIINSDGSLAATCGNALRCLGLLVSESGHWTGQGSHPILRLPIGALVRDSGSLNLTDSEGFALQQNDASFATLLGLTRSDENAGSEAQVRMGSVVDVFMPALPAGFPAQFTQNVFVGLANPHWVFVSDAFSTFSKAEFEAFGLQAQGALRTGLSTGSETGQVPVSNIGMLWPETTSPNAWHLVVFERGAGLTQCCGSGACAARVALETMGRASHSVPEVRFRMPGGHVKISWESSDAFEAQSLVMTGPAVHVATMRPFSSF